MNKTALKKLKVWLPALGFVGATLFSACEQGEPNIDNPNTQPPNDSTEQTDTIPQDTTHKDTTDIEYRDIFIIYSRSDNSIDSLVTKDIYGNNSISPTLIRYDSMPDVRYIYIYVRDYSFINIPAVSIQAMRKTVLEPIMTFSEKMRAKGTFYFKAGEPSKVPEDSLWIVQQGWKIHSYER